MASQMTKAQLVSVLANHTTGDRKSARPRDHEVELRLMDPADGSTRVLLTLFGGQGSTIVPCWHPGGRRFAFVRYALS